MNAVELSLGERDVNQDAALVVASFDWQPDQLQRWFGAALS